MSSYATGAHAVSIHITEPPLYCGLKPADHFLWYILLAEIIMRQSLGEFPNGCPTCIVLFYVSIFNHCTLPSGLYMHTYFMTANSCVHLRCIANSMPLLKP